METLTDSAKTWEVQGNRVLHFKQEKSKKIKIKEKTKNKKTKKKQKKTKSCYHVHVDALEGGVALDGVRDHQARALP